MQMISSLYSNFSTKISSEGKFVYQKSSTALASIARVLKVAIPIIVGIGLSVFCYLQEKRALSGRGKKVVQPSQRVGAQKIVPGKVEEIAKPYISRDQAATTKPVVVVTPSKPVVKKVPLPSSSHNISQPAPKETTHFRPIDPLSQFNPQPQTQKPESSPPRPKTPDSLTHVSSASTPSSDDSFLDVNNSLLAQGKAVSFLQSLDFNQKFTIEENLKHPGKHFRTVSYNHPTSKKSALYIYPTSDRPSLLTGKNIFGLDDHLKYRLLAMSQEHSVKLVYVQDTREMSEVINHYRDGEIQHLVLGGHGTPTSLEFGYHIQRNSRLTTRTPFDRDLNPFNKLADNATIFLDSCKTGKPIAGEQNLCEYISKQAPGRHVYAPKISFGRHNVVLDNIKHWNASILKNGVDQMTIAVH